MKSEIRSNPKNMTYPRLMITNDQKTIILATDIDAATQHIGGTVVFSSQYGLGEHSFKWDGRQFKSFEGEIALSN